MGKHKLAANGIEERFGGFECIFKEGRHYLEYLLGFILITLAAAISDRIYSHCKVLTLLPRGECSCSLVFCIDLWVNEIQRKVRRSPHNTGVLVNKKSC